MFMVHMWVYTNVHSYISGVKQSNGKDKVKKKNLYGKFLKKRMQEEFKKRCF